MSHGQFFHEAMSCWARAGYACQARVPVFLEITATWHVVFLLLCAHAAFIHNIAMVHSNLNIFFKKFSYHVFIFSILNYVETGNKFLL